MKKTSVFILSAVVIAMIAACNGSGSFKRTKSGLMYKIISDEKAPIVKQGQILKFEYVQKVRDSILASSEVNGPAFAPIDSAIKASYDPNEVFGMLRKGDSAVIVLEVDTLVKKMANQGGQLPPFLKAKDKIYITFRVTNVFNNQGEAQKDMEATAALMRQKQEAASVAQKEKDIKFLAEYLKNKGIKAVQGAKGTFAEIKDPGNGVACDSGKSVSVMYTGRTMEGKVFDSNIDPKFNHANQPITFVIGAGGIIPGWDDAIRLFKKGGKGTLYVPSSLGYGKQGSGPDIQPDANLIFDIEIVDVKDATPGAQQAPIGH